MNAPAPQARSRGAAEGPTIGLLGGSFDPVHRGHLTMAERARDQVPCDEVWFVPAFVAVHKPDGPSATADDRLEMLARAIDGRPGLRLETLEIRSGRPWRTIETVRLLRARHPGVRWRLVLGEDSWSAIDGWVEPRDLLELAPAVVQSRPGDPAPPPALAAHFAPFRLRGEPVDASSTAVRAQLARGERPAALPPAVLDYVQAHGLYRPANRGGVA